MSGVGGGMAESCIGPSEANRIRAVAQRRKKPLPDLMEEALDGKI
jgi:hypothetical protein